MKLPAITTLSTDEQVLFEVAEGREAIVRSIRAVNQGSDPVTVNLYVETSDGVKARVAQPDLIIPGGGMALDTDDFELSTGCKIRGVASISNRVVVSIFGKVTNESV